VPVSPAPMVALELGSSAPATAPSQLRSVSGWYGSRCWDVVDSSVGALTAGLHQFDGGADPRAIAVAAAPAAAPGITNPYRRWLAGE
jgi:hypothetical protein